VVVTDSDVAVADATVHPTTTPADRPLHQPTAITQGRTFMDPRALRDGPVHLDVDRKVDVDPNQVRRALAEPEWLGPLISATTDVLPPGTRRFESDLALSVEAGKRVLTFRKAALIDLGPVKSTADGLAAAIAWQASSMAPLFPVFAGQIVADRAGLHLHGVYQPPGGGIGLVIDAAFMHFFARKTASWFLDRLAERASGLSPR